MTGFNFCLFSLASSGGLSSAFFVFMKGMWKMLSRNKTCYAVIHWSIVCPSCMLCDSHCLLSTGALFESVPPLHSPGEFLTFVHFIFPNLFVTATHCTFFLTGTFIFLPSSPTQSGHKFVLQYALQWHVSFSFKCLIQRSTASETT